MPAEIPLKLVRLACCKAIFYCWGNLTSHFLKSVKFKVSTELTLSVFLGFENVMGGKKFASEHT